ncbi:MAG TPA: pilus assembly PilX N-terminal domain-containing protein [Candidatus Polarisedimenticolaceae bacterium]
MTNPTMRLPSPRARERERGSALVIAVLVTVILTLLGVAFLLMGETENKIAENEKLSAQALYFAEAGTRQVKRWFDRPRGTTGYNWNLHNPPPGVLRRDLRILDPDGPGPTAAAATDGNAGGALPNYKQGVDVNLDGFDDVFDRPYRPTPLDMFMGTADGPDIRIDRAFNNASKAFLDTLSERLLANFPVAAANIAARISRIDVYSAPYLQIGPNWTRYGVATVAVTAQIVKTENAVERVLAQRTIRAVINETPYPGPFGPLHSCDMLNWNGSFRVHWGAATAKGPGVSDIPSNINSKFDRSLSRLKPPNGKAEAFYNGDSATFTAMATALETAGTTIPDPWFRFLAGGNVDDWPSADDQYEPPDAPPAAGADYIDYSNIIRNVPNVGCPDFDYETWKTIAQSGGSDVYYYTWVSGDQFRLNSSGPPTAFATITGGKTGLYFFDTKNSARPADDYSNLTPEVQVQGGWQGFRGFMYLNSETFTINGAQAVAATYTFPGEPYFDTNTNGKWDTGEPYVNLNYNSLAARGDDLEADPADTYGSGAGRVYNRKGASVPGTADIWGIVYNTGEFDAQGNPVILGSMITKKGQSKSAGTADLYWDPKLIDEWPPSDWDLPRVVITRYETDPSTN